MDRVLLNNILAYDITVSEAVFWFYSTFNVVAAALLLFISYRLLRPKLPARVNCWFCNKNTLVRYNDRDCWDCPNCDQYNGFTQDGDYNTDISKRMGSQRTQETVTSGNERSNGLCDRCNTNQQLKIQQLARFTPVNDDNYDEEIDYFRKQLDNSYRLCPACEKVLSKTLQSQHYNLLTNRMNDHRRLKHGMPPKDSTQPMLISVKNRFCFVMKLTALGLLLALISLSATTVATDVLSEWLPSSLHHISQRVATSFIQMGITSREISALGAVAYISSHFILPARYGEIRSILWLIIAVLSWIDYVPITLVLSLINLCLQGHMPRMQAFFKKKDLPVMTKMHFQGTPLFESKPSSVQDIVAKSITKSLEVETAPVLVEDIVQEPKKLKKRIQAHKIQVNDRIRTRSQRAISEEVPEKQDEKPKRGRMYSPPPEVYDGFNNLHLDTETPKSKENSGKKWNGILKPAKFLPNSAAPIVLDDYDPSRSSTPSSGSSQQALKDPERFGGKSTPDMGSYSCNKISPLYSKFTPPCSYGVDYNDFNVMNNVHPSFYGNGYTPPYQMYPGPMGHTTVYTYTRPAPFPYSYPSQRFSPPFEYSSPLSPRLSEFGSSTHSVSGNLFSTQPDSDRWCWVKKIFYAASVVFNIVSVSVLLISYFYGTIQLSGK